MTTLNAHLDWHFEPVWRVRLKRATSNIVGRNWDANREEFALNTPLIFGIAGCMAFWSVLAVAASRLI